MRIDQLDYHLPAELIAQAPPTDRDGGRLLVVDVGETTEPGGLGLSDSVVADLAQQLPPRALLVVNDTRVLAARLFARKPGTGGKVEILLVRPEGPGRYERPGPGGETLVIEGEVWRALGKSSKPLRFDQDLEVGDDLSVRILGRAADDGLLRVLLVSERPTLEVIESYGQVPLPPYIKRAATPEDDERYQTVFARNLGAVAAPTAGLHLSNALIGRLAIAGIEMTSVTLHVGLGTFQPVVVEDLDQHPMHEEAFVVGASAVRAITEARRDGRPVIAVGTTVVRALETAAKIAREQSEGRELLIPCHGTTRLLLQPGDELQVVDGLLTNFHLPKTTLLALVAALTGIANLRRAYAHAIEQKYRFYSYGDAMLVRSKRSAALIAEEVRAELAALPAKPPSPPPSADATSVDQGADATSGEGSDDATSGEGSDDEPDEGP